MSDSAYSERRQYLRIDTLVTGRVLSVGKVEDTSHMLASSAGLTKNISPGGLMFRDKQQYAMGDILVVEVDEGVVKDLDENVAKVIKTRGFALGRIVRIEAIAETDEGEVFDYGVSFLSMGDESSYIPLFQDLLNRMEFEGKGEEPPTDEA